MILIICFETVKRIFSKLEKQGYLISGNFNKDPRDKTKWHTIDEKKLFKLYITALYILIDTFKEKNSTLIFSTEDKINALVSL